MPSVSGKNLGLTASLINVIAPVIAIVAVVALFVSLFSTISSVVTNPTAIPDLGLFGGYLVLLVIVGIMSFIGIILFIIAMYQLSHYYNERGIFTNVIAGFLVTIVGSIIAYILEFAYLTTLTGQLTGLGSSPSTSAAASAIMQFFAVFIVILVVIFIIGIISAVLYMRAFNKLAEKSEVGSFHTAGLLYLIGTILTIVGVGIILIWIGWIFAASGFYALKPKPKPAMAPTYTYPAPPPTTPPFAAAPAKRCPNCGADNNPDAIYCRNCGKPI